MSSDNTLDKNKSWLSAEYALGVTKGAERIEAERLVDRDAAFRKSVDAWQNQLSPMLDEIDDVKPPHAVWQNIQSAISSPDIKPENQSVVSGIWKLITALTSTVAVACLGGLLYISGGDFTGGTVSDLKQRLEASQTNIANANSAFDEARERSSALEAELSDVTTSLEIAKAELEQATGSLEEAELKVASAQAEVDDLRQQFEASRPLVASLTQSGDAPAFVAQYDPLKKALLIKTALEDSDEKVPEIWLIPAQGDRKGEVLSLGVMDEKAPDEVKITDEFIKLIGEGGTLAITMEPAGGSPTGVATGPVIALGKLQSF